MIKMGRSLHILFCVLLCLLWGFQSNGITTSQHGGRCRLESQYPTEFTVDVVHNGQTYPDRTVTIYEYRGYKCRQTYSSESSKSCASLKLLPSSFNINTDGDTYQGLHLKKMCRPTNTTDVTRTVSVNLGGNAGTTSVTVEWSNITECSCSILV